MGDGYGWWKMMEKKRKNQRYLYECEIQRLTQTHAKLFEICENTSKQRRSTLLKVRTQCKCRQRKCPQTTSSILVWKCRVELTVMRSGVKKASIGSQGLSWSAIGCRKGGIIRAFLQLATSIRVNGSPLSDPWGRGRIMIECNLVYREQR